MSARGTLTDTVADIVRLGVLTFATDGVVIGPFLVVRESESRLIRDHNFAVWVIRKFQHTKCDGCCHQGQACLLGGLNQFIF